MEGDSRDWYRSVGSRWPTAPVRSICELVNGFPFPSASFKDTGVIPLVRVRDIRASAFKTFLEHRPDSKFVIENGDIVIGMDGDFNCIQWVRGDAALNQRMCLLKSADRTRLRFIAYALPRALKYLNELMPAATVKHLSSTEVMKTHIPMPEAEDLGFIVRYLDHAELRIAKAIAAKTELARLLQQQRLALLCSEVLGRDEDADTSRDFGRLVEARVLDWVGPVPASWDVVPMSGVFDVVKQKNTGLIENTVLSLSYGRVVIKPAEKLRGLVPESFETYQVIEPGDVIVRPTDLQNDTTSLRIGQARDRGIITSAYIALRPKKHVDPDYVMMQLAAYDFLKVLYGFGSGLRQNLDFKHLKHVPMMLPSLAEQSAIVSRVRTKTESVEQAHAAILKEIALLKEYRTRLISDVVTGKMDVRVEAAKLPEIDPIELVTVSVGENGDDEEATDDD